MAGGSLALSPTYGPSPHGIVTAIDGTLTPSKSLRIDGTLGLDLGATTVCQVTQANANVINIDVKKSAVLNGRLQVTMTGAFPPGTRFTLLHAPEGLHFPRYPDTTFSSVSINYSVCPTCAPAFTPEIQYDYDGGNVYLYLNPEPESP